MIICVLLDGLMERLNLWHNIECSIPLNLKRIKFDHIYEKSSTSHTNFNSSCNKFGFLLCVALSKENKPNINNIEQGK